MCLSSLHSRLSFPHLIFQFCKVQTCTAIYLLYWLISFSLFLIHILLISLLDSSTLAQGKVPLSWILTSHLVYVLAPSKAWRPMCSGWILPRSCPPGLICWWRAATVLPSSSKRSPQVQMQRFVWLSDCTCYGFLHLIVEKFNFETWSIRGHQEFATNNMSLSLSVAHSCVSEQRITQARLEIWLPLRSHFVIVVQCKIPPPPKKMNKRGSPSTTTPDTTLMSLWNWVTNAKLCFWCFLW